MSIDEIITHRGIREVLHFTTNRGLVGALALAALKPRKRLPRETYLEFIYKPNCADRSRDVAWHDYVNLSITRINARLFGISSENWHRDINGWWCVLSFTPDILTHEGVIFTTTNNMYTGVQRDSGTQGLEALFAPRIVQWYGTVVTRSADAKSCEPTCIQAEVLYPGDLSVSYLQRIYVRDPENVDPIHGVFGALSMNSVPISVEPGVFQ